MISCSWKAGILAAGLLLLAADTLAVERAVPPPDVPPIFKEMKISEFLKIRTREILGPGGERLTLKQRASFEWLKHDMKRTLKRRGDQTVGQYLAAEKRKNDLLILILALLLMGLLLFIAAAVNFGQ